LRKILAVDDSALIHQMYNSSSPATRAARLVSAMNAGGLDKLAQEEAIGPHPAGHQHAVMNGLEFLQRVQKEAAYKDIPVIIISTRARKRTRSGASRWEPRLRQESLSRLRAPQPESRDPPALSPCFRPAHADGVRGFAELVGIYLEDAREHSRSSTPPSSASSARPRPRDRGLPPRPRFTP